MDTYHEEIAWTEMLGRLNVESTSREDSCTAAGVYFDSTASTSSSDAKSL